VGRRKIDLLEEVNAMRIEIFGPGCPKCKETGRRVEKALSELAMSAEIEHVQDPKLFAQHGVMFTPAVVIDGEVKVSGNVPTVEEIKKLLEA
jgi:small redox-active disulfide protein 2